MLFKIGKKMIKSIEQFLFNNKVIIPMRFHDGDLIMGIMFGLSRSGCILRVSHCVVDPDKEGKALHSTRGHSGGRTEIAPPMKLA